MASDRRSKLIVALDVPTFEDAKKWVSLLSPQVKCFKVGSVLFTAEGPKVVEMIQKHKGNVFLDLKFHDIPNTVAAACRMATRMGVLMMNLHVVGGKDVLQKAVEAVQEESDKAKNKKPLLLGVTLLTHLNALALQEVGWEIAGSMEEKVVFLAERAKENGLDGVVCSPQEIAPVKTSCGEAFVVVSPGIRPVGSLLHDQTRISSPQEAVKAGADYLVVGRPILESKAPLQMVEEIFKEIESV